MALKTKSLARAFYGKEAKFSYWNGCSTGGRQGLKEVQRHPEDFDGVLAGAPVIHLDKAMAAIWPEIVMQQDLGAPIADAKLAAATAAAIAACDPALTGQPDGYVSDPSACHYDPAVDPSLLCESDGGSNLTAACLTKAEAGAINKIWHGPTTDGTVPAPAVDNGHDPRGSLAPDQLWFWVARGAALAGHSAPPNMALVALALGDPSFSAPGSEKWKTIGYTGPTSFANVFATYEQFFHDLIGTADPDIHAFRDRGGKLLMWHGTGDSRVPPPQLDQLLRSRVGGRGWIRRGADVRALLSGAWHRPLLLGERLGHQPSRARRSAGQPERRSHRRLATMGRERRGSTADCRHVGAGRHPRAHATVVSLPDKAPLCRRRREHRFVQLRVRRTGVASGAHPLRKTATPAGHDPI